MRIKSQNLVLRPFKPADAPRFVKWFNDSDVNKFLHRRSMRLDEELKWIRALPKDKFNIALAIDTKTGTHIGSIGLHRIDRVDKRATFGIMIGDKSYWDQGLGTEAARLMLDYGFRKLKLHRIDLEVYEFNPRARKVYKRLGFKMEGKKRLHRYYRGAYHNVYYMGMLADEWKNKITKRKS